MNDQIQETPEGPNQDVTKRRSSIYGFVVVVLVLFGMFYVLQMVSDNPSFKYRGLVLSEEVEMDEGTRTLIVNRIETEKAALAAQIKANGGSANNADKVDWNLYEALAWDYLMLGDFVGARETYEEYFTLNAINYTAWNNYGTILEKMGDDEKALEAFKEAYTLYAKEEFYRDYLELVKKQNTDGSQDALILQTLEDGVVRVGQTTWFMVELAQYYLEHGDCDQALDHYTVAKSLDPENTALDADIQSAREQCIK